MLDYDRFIAKVLVQPTGCWEWIGFSYRGYGIFWDGKKRSSAHRWSYQYHKGLLHPKLNVCHSCDNSICVNPDHLWQGTHQDNMIDRDIKGRQPRGESQGSSKLTEQDILEIRDLYGHMKTKDIADKYKIGPQHVRRIGNKQAWKHI